MAGSAYYFSIGSYSESSGQVVARKPQHSVGGQCLRCAQSHCTSSGINAQHQRSSGNTGSSYYGVDGQMVHVVQGDVFALIKVAIHSFEILGYKTVLYLTTCLVFSSDLELAGEATNNVAQISVSDPV